MPLIPTSGLYAWALGGGGITTTPQRRHRRAHRRRCPVQRVPRAAKRPPPPRRRAAAGPATSTARHATRVSPPPRPPRRGAFQPSRRAKANQNGQRAAKGRSAAGAGVRTGAKPVRGSLCRYPMYSYALCSMLPAYVLPMIATGARVHTTSRASSSTAETNESNEKVDLMS